MRARRSSFVTDESLSNLNTLLDDSASLTKFRDGLLELDPALGQTSELARGMYQAISSGVNEGDALQFIADSAKTARAGLATTFETVDAGTSVMASFGIEGKNVMTVYDKMFETVKRGKIELPQLASSIGLVSNVAAQTGLSVDEMFAAIATASRTNRPTVAIEGMRSALVNVIKPSEQAAKLAESLGLQFDAQSLKAKGLAGFLNEVSEATGGDAAKMAVLFGDVQALNFVMSVTGNQAKTFASDLQGIAAASGTVEEAFQKQKQSLSAQAEELKVAFTQGLIKTFLFLEPLLTGTLSVVNRYPAVFSAAIVVVSGLAAAYTLYNTQLAINAATHLPQVIKGIQSVVFWMIHFRTALTDTQTALTASAGWIGLVVAAIGLLIYAWRSYEGAADRANKITKEQVAAQSSALAESKSLAAEVRNVAAAQEGSAERHERLNAVLGRLDPVTQAYIKSLKDEKTQISVLTGEIDKNLNARKAILEATLRTVGSGALEQKASIDSETQSIDRLNTKINELQKNVTGHNIFINPQAADAKLRMDNFSQSIVDANVRLTGFNTSLTENKVKLFQTAQGLNLSEAELRLFFQQLGYTKQQIDFLTAGYAQATDAAKNNANATNQTTQAIDQQANSVRNLRAELAALAKAPQEKIDQAVLDIVKNAKDATEAKRMARERLRDDSSLKDAVNESRRLKESQAAAESVFTPSLRSGGGSGGGRASDPIKEATREIAKLNKEISALEAGGGHAFEILTERDELQETKRLLTDILKLRRELTIVADIPIPPDQAGRELQLKALQQFKRDREEIANLAGDLGLGPQEAGTSQEAHRLVEQLSLLKKTRDEIKQQLTTVKEKIFELGAASEDGRTPLEKFDFTLRELEKTGKLTAEQFKLLQPNIEEMRAELRRMNDTDNSNKWAKELRKNTLEVTESLTEFRREMLEADLELKMIGEATPLDKLLTKLEAIKEFKLDPDGFKPLIDFLKETGNFDLPTMAGIVKEILINAGAAIDPAKIDQTSNAIAALVLQAQELSEKLTPVERERQKLNREFRDLQGEVAIASETAAERYRNAWQRAINDIQLADLDATESMIASQVKIADQGVYHATQANAKILDFLAQQKGITDIVADSKIGLMQKSFEGVDNVLDRIIPKAHGFGDIIKQIVADLLKLEASNWFRKILGLEGAAGPGGTPTFAGGGGGFNPGSLLNLSGGGNSGSGNGRGGIGGIFNSFRQNGFLGGLKNLFGFGGGAASAATAGGLPSIAGGAASQFAGGFMPVIPGIGGGAAAGAAGTGAAAGGSSMLGSLGALFTNPWTAVAAGAAIGGFMLWKHFKNGTEKKLREAIQNEYQVSIKDMKTLSEIKQIGEGVFGKGQVSKHLQETIRLDQVKPIIQAYAEGTGQQSKLVTQKQLADPNFSGNRFITRIAGGIIPGFTHGYDHVPVLADGGEYMLRSAVTAREGLERVNALNEGRATIAPTTPKPRVPVVVSAPASSGNSSQSSKPSDSGLPPAIVAAIVGALESNTATSQMLLKKLQTMGAGAFLAWAAKENPNAVADGLNRALDNSHKADELKRKLGGGGTL